MAAVKEHVLHLTQKALSEGLAKATRGNRYVKFKTQHVPNRSFRWIIDGRI